MCRLLFNFPGSNPSSKSSPDLMEDVPIVNPGISNPSSPFLLMEPQSGAAPSNPTKMCTKKGIGSQHCSACKMVGHNSKSLFPLSCKYLMENPTCSAPKNYWKMILAILHHLFPSHNNALSKCFIVLVWLHIYFDSSWM